MHFEAFPNTLAPAFAEFGFVRAHMRSYNCQGKPHLTTFVPHATIRRNRVPQQCGWFIDLEYAGGVSVVCNMSDMQISSLKIVYDKMLASEHGIFQIGLPYDIKLTPS